MIRFYWLEPGVLAGCSRPGARPGRREPHPDELATDLARLRSEGIARLLSLTETPLPAAALAESGLVGLHLPVPDFQPPSPEQLRLALAWIEDGRRRREATAVHCLAGQGRTGSVLAAWLIRHGHDAPAAIAAVRAICPGAVEAAAQRDALAVFATERSWLV